MRDMRKLTLLGLLFISSASARPMTSVFDFLGYQATGGPVKSTGDVWRWPLKVTNTVTDAVVRVNVLYIVPAGKKYVSQVGAEYFGGFGQCE